MQSLTKVDGFVLVYTPVMFFVTKYEIRSKVKLYVDTGAPVKAYNADAGESS